MDANETFLDLWQASKLLGYPPRKLKRLARLGKVPHYRLPNTRADDPELRFREVELVDWLESHRQGVGNA